MAKEKNLFTTPIKLTGMKEGYYQVTLKKEGYADITKSIDVYRKRTLFSSKETNKFVIPFETKLEIKSNPAGLIIYVDGKTLGQKTPSIVPVEVGKHAVRLLSSDQDSIGSVSVDEAPASVSKCILDLANNKNILDNDVWDFRSRTDEDNNIVYQLQGQLLKVVRIDSQPGGADLYLDGHNKSAGKTPLTLKILPGKHRVFLEKKGFTNEANPKLRVPTLLSYRGEISVKSAVSEQGDNQFTCRLKE